MSTTADSLSHQQVVASTEHGITLNAVDQIILVIHGIRDFGEWNDSAIKVLETNRIIPSSFKYGWYSPFKFAVQNLFSDTALTPLEKLRGEISQIKRTYPDVKISVFAHSFGTYLTYRLLKADRDLRLFRVALCGSVLPQNTDWSEFNGRIGEVGDLAMRRYLVNHCGSSDRWPIRAKMKKRTYGSYGTDGGGTIAVTDRFHEGDHGLFLQEEFIRDHLKPFFHEGLIPDGNGKQRKPIKTDTRTWIKRGLVFSALASGGFYGYKLFGSRVPISNISYLDFVEKAGPKCSMFEVLIHEYGGKQVSWECEVLEAIPGTSTPYYVVQPIGTEVDSKLIADVKLASVEDFHKSYAPTSRGQRGTNVTVTGILKASILGLIIEEARVAPLKKTDE